MVAVVLAAELAVVASMVVARAGVVSPVGTVEAPEP